MAKRSNPWLAHLKKTWARVKGKMSYRQAMVEAKKDYKKVGAGAEPEKKKVRRRRRKKT
jgi:hypothetical protein